MYAGKIIDGKIVYKDNVDYNTEKDGYFFHDDKDVITFILEDKIINWNYIDNHKEGNRYSYSFDKNKPSHIMIVVDENGEYHDVEECLKTAYNERMEHWNNMWDKNHLGDLSNTDKENAFYLLSGITSHDMEIETMLAHEYYDKLYSGEIEMEDDEHFFDFLDEE